MSIISNIAFGIGMFLNYIGGIYYHEIGHKNSCRKLGVEASNPMWLRFKNEKIKIPNFLKGGITHTPIEQECKLTPEEEIKTLKAGWKNNQKLFSIGILGVIASFIIGAITSTTNHSLANFISTDLMSFFLTTTIFNAIFIYSAKHHKSPASDGNRIKAIKEYAKQYEDNPIFENKRELEIIKLIGDYHKMENLFVDIKDDIVHIYTKSNDALSKMDYYIKVSLTEQTVGYDDLTSRGDVLIKQEFIKKSEYIYEKISSPKEKYIILQYRYIDKTKRTSHKTKKVKAKI